MIWLIVISALVIWFLQFALKLRIGALLWYIQENNIALPTEDDMREGSAFVFRNQMLDLLTGRGSSSVTIRSRLLIRLLRLSHKLRSLRHPVSFEDHAKKMSDE